MAAPQLSDLPVKKTYSVRDVLIIVALVANPVIWFAKIDAHVSNEDVHPSNAVRTHERRVEQDRVAQETANTLAAVDKTNAEFRKQVLEDLRQIKSDQAELARSIGRLEGKDGKKWR